MASDPSSSRDVGNRTSYVSSDKNTLMHPLRIARRPHETPARCADDSLASAHSWGGDKLLARPAEAVDLQLHHVTDPQVGLGLRLAQGNPRGGTGVDDVARVEHDEPAQVPDDLGDAEGHVLGVAVLPLL